MQKKTIKVPFDKWKDRSREIDLNTVYVSMDGEKQIVTVKPLKKK